MKALQLCGLLSFALLTNTLWVQAQITSPVIRGKFGVDADAENNWFNGTALAGNDDWYYNKGVSSPSTFVIDTSGAAEYVAQYAAGVGLNRPFFRKMNYPAYTQLGSTMLIDAIYVRDYHGTDSTVFALGSNKNGQSPASWACPDYNSVPNKNDILDAYVHIRREGPTASIADTLWMFGGLAMDANNGNRYFDFELYQTNIFFSQPTHSFIGYGPDAGHTSWKFDAAGNVTQVGDIIFSAEYGGTSLSSIEARIWIDTVSMAITPAAFNWTGTYDGANTGSQFGYAGIQPKTADPFYFGTENMAPTWAGPFNLVRADNSVDTNFDANQFMEFGVNLTVLGLNPTLLGTFNCAMPYSKILIKTRSSSSFNAELKDFIGPFDQFLPPQANVAADVPFYCGTIGVSQLQVTDPYATSTYTWSTTNGNIVGATTGTAITVDQPGTYVVTQTLNSGCPAFATDTLVITYDPLCTTLANNDVQVKGMFTNNMVQVNWLVTQNQHIQYCTVERSFDGVHFTLAETVNNQQMNLSRVTYQTTDNVHGLPVSYVYYRVKITGNDGSVQYSKVVRVELTAANDISFALQPNPVRDHVQLNINSTADRKVQVFIYNVTGQLMTTMSSQVRKGYSTIALSDFQGWPKGIYTVKVLGGVSAFIEKMVLVN